MRFLNRLKTACLHPGGSFNRDACWAFLQTLIRRYEWIHLALGILGNISFLSGSMLMLNGVKTQAIWLFIIGSSGMLIGSLGSAAVSLERSRERKREQAREEQREQRRLRAVADAWRP